jgi:hypothetical protein
MIGLALVIGVYIFSSESEVKSDKSNEYNQTALTDNLLDEKASDIHSDHDHNDMNQHSHSSSTDQETDSLDQSMRNKVVEGFSFEDDVQKLEALASQYPESKNQIITLIQKEDPFKSRKIKVRPHTSDELTQRKMGAIKVLALKTLLQKETNRDLLKRDLENISNRALDPTIVEIAKAALKSENEGRSFIDDFSDGVDTNLPE